MVLKKGEKLMVNRTKEVLTKCDNSLYGHYPHFVSMKKILQELQEYVKEDEYGDDYGEGDYIANFEKQIADLLGKESAVFMPSGTMAQQIALRIWCEKKQNFKVVFHPTAHLEIAEHKGYSFLHNIQRVQFSVPELLSHRLLTFKDFQNINESFAVALLELPQRLIGGQLPSWTELSQISRWCKEKEVVLHLDGARIWECKHFYQRSYKEICNFFESVYVSFYKGLGGLTGAALAGDKTFIAEARIWQRRYGGNLRTQFPYVISAKIGLEKHLEKMDLYVSKTIEIVELLSEFEQIQIVPNPPHINMFQMFIKGEPEKIAKAHLQMAENYKTWLFYPPGKSLLPNYSQTEMMIGENALKVDLEIVHKMLNEIFAII